VSLLGSSLLGFLLAVAILVTVHEFGHYLVARWCGVTVQRFSVGFGPVLLRWVGRRSIFKGTEFAISALPLGGYVRMFDTRDASSGLISAAQQSGAFDRQALWKRSLIVAAGPLANFLLAGALYSVALLMPMRDLSPVIASPPVASAAHEAGLRGGERVLQIARRDVLHWGDVRWQLLAHMFDSELEIVVESDGIERSYLLRRDETALSGADVTGKRLSSWGLSFDQPAIIGSVIAGGPAHAAGIKPGDRVSLVNGIAVRQWSEFTLGIQKSPATPVELTVDREGAAQTLTVTPRSVANGQATVGRIDVLPVNPMELGERFVVSEQRSLLNAVTEGALRSAEATWLTVRVLWGMVTGEISLRQVSGPLSMAEGAGATLKQGFSAFVMFLAIVSVSIGVLNLLPVPMLDGGQLLYHLFEAIKGAPLSERLEALGQRIGIGFVTALTALALYNDFLRIFS
jgi:regulator of sigma E protease